MKIEALTKLLQNKYGDGAYAYIPEKQGKSRRSKVAVVFNTNGKVYEYASTIHGVADRLHLIPQVEHWNEAMKVINHFAAGNTNPIVSFAELCDTVRITAYDTLGIEIKTGRMYLDGITDEYDRHLEEFYV